MTHSPPSRLAIARLAVALAFAVALCAAHGRSRAFAQTNGPAPDARRLEQLAAEAYKAKDFPAYLKHLEAALALRPEHPRLMFNLAGAHALAGHRAEAFDHLARVAAMGLVFPAAEETDFDSIKDADEFKAILKKFEANKSHVGRSVVAFTLEEKGLITEGVAHDPATGNFYVGSVRRRKILSVDKRGAAREFAGRGSGLWAVLGMKVDAKRRHLWVASSALPQMEDFAKADEGTSGVFKFDLATGRLIKKYVLANTPRRHALGDLVVGKSGDVYATDSLSAAVYRIDAARDEIAPFIEGAPFASPQGLDFSADGRTLYVADYSRGLFSVDLASGKVSPVRPAPGSTALGIDGLYFHKGSLVGIQNGTNPHRVVRMTLAKSGREVERFEVVEANHPAFDEPTLGVIVGREFYYVANSQWGAVDNKGQLAPADKLRAPVVLKVGL